MPNHADGVYTRKDRSGYWIQWVDAQGKRRIRKCEAPTLTQARNARAREMVNVEKAKVLGFAPPGEDTFAQVAERFLKYQKARITAKAYERERGIVEGHLKPFFSGQLSSIRRVDVQRYVTKRTTDVSSGTIIKELNSLKHLFRLAVEWEIVPTNPADRVKSPKAPAGRMRYLQPTELTALLDVSPDWLRPIIQIAVSTGMRRSEILGLRWIDVDLASGCLLLPQTKNGEGRTVYLNQIATTAIRSLVKGKMPSSTDKLFKAATRDQVTMAFRRACRLLKIENFRFHDLRHTAASWMRMRGADIHTVAQLLGHKDLRMAARYQHLSPQFLSEAVGLLDKVISDGEIKVSQGSGEIQNRPVLGDSRYRGATEENQAEEGRTVIH